MQSPKNDWQKMEAIQKRVDANQEVAGEYLTYLLSNVNMSSKWCLCEVFLSWRMLEWTQVRDI